MKVEIEEINNGYIVTYYEQNGDKMKPYVYRSVDDLTMIECIAKTFLKRRIAINEK